MPRYPSPSSSLRRHCRAVVLIVLVAVMGQLARPRLAAGSCDVIPGAKQSFRGTTGAIDRPFASPGDWVQLSRDLACPGNFLGFFARPAEQVVTLMFKPPAGPRNVVFLATDCAALEPFRQRCEAR